MTLLVNAQHKDGILHKHGMRSSSHRVDLNFQRFCPDEAWTPAMNLYRDDEHYHIVLDLPGITGRDINVRATNGEIVISGSRDMPDVPSASGAVRLLHMEIDHGRFCCSLDLPDDADLDSHEYSLSDGYLWVHIARKAVQDCRLS